MKGARARGLNARVCGETKGLPPGTKAATGTEEPSTSTGAESSTAASEPKTRTKKPTSKRASINRESIGRAPPDLDAGKSVDTHGGRRRRILSACWKDLLIIYMCVYVGASSHIWRSYTLSSIHHLSYRLAVLPTEKQGEAECLNHGSTL